MASLQVMQVTCTAAQDRKSNIDNISYCASERRPVCEPSSFTAANCLPDSASINLLSLTSPKRPQDSYTTNWLLKVGTSVCGALGFSGIGCHGICLSLPINVSIGYRSSPKMKPLRLCTVYWCVYCCMYW